MTLIDLHSK